MNNEYEHHFQAHCPVLRDKVRYRLHIQTEGRIDLQRIIECCKVVTAQHEDLADHLKEELGGEQTLIAEHKGSIMMRTTR